MATRKRKRKFARFAALTITLMIALLWLTSIWILVIAKPTSNTIVAIYSGGVGMSVWPYSVLSGDDKSRLRLVVNESPTRWLPKWATIEIGLGPAFVRNGYLPLWIPLLLCIVATIVIFRRTRMTPTSCGACGYDLTGNVSGVCPECGERVASGDEHCPIDDGKPHSGKPG